MTRNEALLIAAIRQLAERCRYCADFGDWRVQWSDRSVYVCHRHLMDAKRRAANDGADTNPDPLVTPYLNSRIARDAIQSVTVNQPTGEKR